MVRQFFNDKNKFVYNIWKGGKSFRGEGNCFGPASGKKPLWLVFF